MTDADRQLVDVIARQVLSILQRQDAASAPAATAGATATGSSQLDAPVSIAPPIGVCTGDYSQFPELAGRRVGASPRPPSPAAPPEVPPEVPPQAPPQVCPEAPSNQASPLSGIVTANQLQAAMDASSDRIARLASDARLTPLANDLARQHARRVVRIDAAQATTTTATAPTPSNWLWWADGPCSSVDAVVAERRAVLRSITATRSDSALPQVVRELATSVRENRVAGGVLFVATAARAMCMANRCPSLRAVLGTCDEAVEQGVTELGANVLVIEYPFVGKRAMRAMVERFTAQIPQAPAAMQRMLAELQRCG